MPPTRPPTGGGGSSGGGLPLVAKIAIGTLLAVFVVVGYFVVFFGEVDAQITSEKNRATNLQSELSKAEESNKAYQSDLEEKTRREKLAQEPQGPFERVLVIVTEAPEDARLGRAVRFESLRSQAPVYRERSPEDLACIVYSSGTGGTPKGCMLSHANYLAQAEVLGRMYPMVEGERYFSVLPTNHAIDFMCGFLIPLMMGATVSTSARCGPRT